MATSEFWLISAPGDKTPQQTFDKLNKATAIDNQLSMNFPFHIPDLKVRRYQFALLVNLG